MLAPVLAPAPPASPGSTSTTVAPGIFSLACLASGVKPLGLHTPMMCGTLPAIGGVRPAARFDFELSDPVLERQITAGYDIIELPAFDPTAMDIAAIEPSPEGDRISQDRVREGRLRELIREEPVLERAVQELDLELLD